MAGAGNTSTTFEQLLADFKQDLTDHERSLFHATTFDDLKREIDRIQKKQAKTKTMQNMTRIRGFLEAMEVYSKVMDVFVNVHDFVAFIWVAIQLAKSSDGYADTFRGQ